MGDMDYWRLEAMEIGKREGFLGKLLKIRGNEGKRRENAVFWHFQPLRAKHFEYLSTNCGIYT